MVSQRCIPQMGLGIRQISGKYPGVLSFGESTLYRTFNFVSLSAYDNLLHKNLILERKNV